MAVIELDQAFETPVTEYRRGAINVRYAYSRSKETIEIGERGQDYLVFKTTTNKICFALCDGVGNSFFGGLGAQILGESIIKWLERIDLEEKIKTGRLGRIANDLEKYLNDTSDFGREVVATRDLTGFPEAQQQAYINQIKTGGTQSNFTCGIIESPTSEAPKGRFLLFWLGDARLRIFKGSDELTKIMNPKWEEAKWGEGEGWSSKNGVIGHIFTYFADLTKIDSVISHSDGFKLLERQIKPGITSETLNRAITSLRNLKTKSDDISFIEIIVSDAIFDSSEDVVEMVRAHEEAKTTEQINNTPPGSRTKLPVVGDNNQNTQKNNGQTQSNNSPRQKFPNNIQGRTWRTLFLILFFTLFTTTFFCGFLAGSLYQINQSDNIIIVTSPAGINDPNPLTPMPTRLSSLTPTITTSPTETITIVTNSSVILETTAILLSDGLVTATPKP